MDKADWAFIVAIGSAAFTGWQAYSGHVVAKITRDSAKRKAPAFEVSSQPFSKFEGWRFVSIAARNFEPVSVQIERLKYAKPGVVLLHEDAQFVGKPHSYPITEVDALPEERAAREISYRFRLGAGGEQEYKGDAGHTPRPTIYLRLFAKGNFDPKHLHVEWHWADGQKK
ncbi:hypothetical protein [Ponticoccus litoralis]|uniref:Uncharacterized protein n=1 Tax=Ponticoccus litoralis TaxID=422297 RepID=A0AAW9S7T9_9RHOB